MKDLIEEGRPSQIQGSQGSRGSTSLNSRDHAPTRARILHIIAHLDKGGAEHQLRLLLSASRHDHAVALPARNMPTPDRSPTRLHPLPSLRPLTLIRDLRRIIREDRIDVVHLWLPERLTVPAAIAARLEGVHLISGDRREPRRIGQGGLRDRLRYIPHLLADLIVPNYPLVLPRLSLRRALGLPAKALTIPNAINAPVCPVAPGNTTAPRRILFVGRLVRQKDVPTLLRAAPALARAGFDGIEIVGQGAEDQRLRALATRVQLPVTFHGPLRDWATRFDPDTHLFVLPSRAEGMSNALFEAIAAGFHTLTARAPTLDHLLADWPERPASFTPGKARALARTAHGLRIAPQDRAALQSRLSDFSLTRMAQSYDTLYDAALGTGPNAASTSAAPATQQTEVPV